MLPLAHAGHYVVWALYALPVLVVLGAIVRTVLVEKRRKRDGPPGG
jgi:heme exporter protein D